VVNNDLDVLGLLRKYENTDKLKKQAADEIERLRAELQKAQPKKRELQPCGTPAAHKRHRKRGEQPCELCRQAVNAYQSNRNKERTKLKRQENQRVYAGELASYTVELLLEDFYSYWRFNKTQARKRLLPLRSSLHDLFPEGGAW